MSKLDTIYASNPLTELPLDALLYALDNPSSTDDDAGINANDLLAQIIGTRIDGARLTWNSATSITIGTGLLVAQNRDVINITSAITKSSLSLSASTWYHVYVYLSGGSPAGEVVTTAPTAWKGTAYSKTGDTSRRYVGSIKTDGSGNVYKFVHYPDSNEIQYLDNTLNGAPFAVLVAGISATATLIDCSAVVPVTGRRILARFASNADLVIYFGTGSGVSSTVFCRLMSHGNTVVQEFVTTHPLSASQTFYYIAASGGGSGGAYVDCYGYLFER